MKQNLLKAFQEKQKKQDNEVVVVPLIDVTDADAVQEDEKEPDGS